MVQILTETTEDAGWFEAMQKECGLTLGYAVSQYRSNDNDIVAVPEGFEAMMRLSCSQGRLHQPADYLYNAASAVIGYDYWQQLNCPEINEIIEADGYSCRLIGVLSEDTANAYFDAGYVIIVPSRWARQSADTYYFKTAGNADGWLTDRFGENNYLLIDQKVFTQLINELTEVVSLIMIALSWISGFVAVIGLINQALIQLPSQMGFIGLQKALGGSRRDIIRLFLYRHLLVMTLAVLMAAGGLAVLRLALQTAGIALAKISRTSLALAAALSAVAFAGALYPAFKAGRLTIIEALAAH